MEQRVLVTTSNGLKDISVDLSKPYGDAASLTLTKDNFLYIGSRLPFNHLFFKLKTPSLKTAKLNVQYYDGTSWVSVVEVIDETEGFTKTGHLQFTPDRNKSWGMKSTNDNGTKITELQTVNIYDRYWTRLSFDVDLDAVAIQWLGQLFSNDNDLKVEFADLCRQKTIAAFSAGKTDWEDQHIQAAKLICDDLVNNGVITGAGQILDWREYTDVAIQKVAVIAMSEFGEDYIDRVAKAQGEYKSRLAKRKPLIDRNGDAVESSGERNREQGYFSR